MGLVFANDPEASGLPAVGDAPVLAAERTRCGFVAVWDPRSGDAAALASFLGSDFLSVDGLVYERSANGVLTPVGWTKERRVLVRPPAGPLHVVDEVAFKQGWAQVVDTDALAVDGGPVEDKGDGYEGLTVPQLVDQLRERGLDAGGKKDELIARLREADVAALVKG